MVLLMEDNSICVITHPLSDVSETAVNGLLEVVSAMFPDVSLITANLPDDSDVWEKHEVREVSDSDTGGSVLVAPRVSF